MTIATLVALTFLYSSGSAVAVEDGPTFPARPASGTLIVDEAGVLGSVQSQIAAVQRSLLANSRVELAVVTIKTLEEHGAHGVSIESYAMSLFNAWRIGANSPANNGILLLVSVGDRRARIELGAGWGRSWDTRAQQIMDGSILPKFRDERYGQGVLDGVNGLAAMAPGQVAVTPAARPVSYPSPYQKEPSSGTQILLILAGLGFFALFVFAMIKAPKQTSSMTLGCLLGLILGALFSGDSGGSGGFSGGGGASGSW